MLVEMKNAIINWLLIRLLWHPIATAPRDGTVVNLWHKSGSPVYEAWWTEDDCWTCLLDDSQFTHWSPVVTPFGMLVAVPDEVIEDE